MSKLFYSTVKRNFFHELEFTDYKFQEYMNLVEDDVVFEHRNNYARKSLTKQSISEKVS